MFLLRIPSLWLFSFTVLFFLALDFWSWEQSIEISWFGLPTWVFYFICLQFVLAIAIAVFSLTFWQSTSDEEQ